ncbi:TPA: hypothetical protein H2A59_004572 [Salmonella enterica]|nr:hypothetical protein [Salmonella enterica]
MIGRKNNTHRLTRLGLYQMVRQRRADVLFRFNFNAFNAFNEFIAQRRRQMEGVGLNDNRPETTPDSINTQDAKRALRRRDGKL